MRTTRMRNGVAWLCGAGCLLAAVPGTAARPSASQDPAVLAQGGNPPGEAAEAPRAAKDVVIDCNDPGNPTVDHGKVVLCNEAPGSSPRCRKPRDVRWKVAAQGPNRRACVTESSDPGDCFAIPAAGWTVDQNDRTEAAQCTPPEGQHYTVKYDVYCGGCGEVEDPAVLDPEIIVEGPGSG